MGNSIYYGVYPKECNNDKVLPYLDIDSICEDLNISKDSQKEFFNILRKYSFEKYSSEDDSYNYHCFIITYYEDYYNFYKEVNVVLPENIECDFDNDILIFWVV